MVAKGSSVFQCRKKKNNIRIKEEKIIMESGVTMKKNNTEDIKLEIEREVLRSIRLKSWIYTNRKKVLHRNTSKKKNEQ